MRSVEELMKLASMLKGLTILGIRPSSPAALAGVRYGDILLSVNGAPTPDWSSFVRAREAVGSSMDLVLFRDGAEQTITVHLPERTESVHPIQVLSDVVEQGIPLALAQAPREDEAPN